MENLYRAGVNVHPAVMVSLSPRQTIESLAKRLRRIHRSFQNVEIEELLLCGDVEEWYRRAKIGYGMAYEPGEIPPEQV